MVITIAGTFLQGSVRWFYCVHNTQNRYLFTSGNRMIAKHWRQLRGMKGVRGEETEGKAHSMFQVTRKECLKLECDAKETAGMPSASPRDKDRVAVVPSERCQPLRSLLLTCLTCLSVPYPHVL